MNFLIKLILSAAVIGAIIHRGDALAGMLLVLVAPLIAVLFTSDIMKFFGGSAYALRKHAYDSDVRVFKYGYTPVRMIMYRNRAWFSARSVCDALGHRNVQRTVRHYATTEYCVMGLKKETFVSESGVRRLAEISRHNEAQSFLRWFDNEVTATLEKTRRRMKASGAIDVDLSAPTADEATPASATAAATAAADESPRARL